ncbi:uncharacterized protein (TIGR00288 family) [Kerstersia gyiorum]|uniref:Uncharacterized protein (TIGR00288 family) n=1 Tax=Kerstersia gyiorum TaxID=206506 RepID=A0A4V2EZS4_9BURK|nr:NYN domain-containing protein [Kerstersia gyiorum]KAB0543007.1 NYN domain-containing protein [Kerstersia gyiorum]RZS67500.1 uncharacterized protein (TIGR00288 family) [Kerstersia gyiorum]
MAIGNSDSISMAVFCDFENVALGVRDAQYEQFDIRPVLERLLVKGSIVVKKAYCDWERYKGFKNAMHEANFELIEIPHVRQSGKNSADIRLVVDALDLCYTKSHVDTFVIVSGDSDFSPLVSKLRENAKQVIGVGVKQSTSDLLIANCDEFIFYDDLVREQARRSGRQSGRDSSQAKRGAGQDDARPRREDLETRRAQALEIAMETYDALSSERGDGSKLWASVLKDAIKRRRPDFNESYYGFRAFGNLLEEAQARGLLRVGRDERSGTYIWRDGSSAGTDRHAASEEAPAIDTGKHEGDKRQQARTKNRPAHSGNPDTQATVEASIPAPAASTSAAGSTSTTAAPQETPPQPVPPHAPGRQSSRQATGRRRNGGKTGNEAQPDAGASASPAVDAANRATASSGVAPSLVGQPTPDHASQPAVNPGDSSSVGAGAHPGGTDTPQRLSEPGAAPDSRTSDAAQAASLADDAVKSRPAARSHRAGSAAKTAKASAATEAAEAAPGNRTSKAPAKKPQASRTRTDATAATSGATGAGKEARQPAQGTSAGVSLAADAAAATAGNAGDPAVAATEKRTSRRKPRATKTASHTPQD